MICFKKVGFKAEDGQVLKAALDRFSEEWPGLSGFQPNRANLFFVKQTGKGSVNYTRLMSRFDVVADEGNSFCRFRLSNRSTGVLILIAGGIIANVVFADENPPHYGRLIVLCIALTIFILFAVLECLQTQMKIKRAVSNYQLIQRIKILFSEVK
jgi:hypothetical protein